jgi:hypothetical protein
MGDQLSNDWVGPDGVVVPGPYWDPLAGYYCFTGSSLSIGNTPSSRLGPWRARIFDNGSFWFSVPFTIN